MAGWQSGLSVYLRDHLTLYLFVSVLFVMGVIFGSLMVNGLSLEQRQDLENFLGSFVHASQGNERDAQALFFDSFGSYFRWIILIFVLGLSVIGLPLILLLDFLKGVLVGFSVGFLIGQYSWRGIVIALTAIAPQNMVAIPAILIGSVTALSFSLHLINNRLLKRKSTIGKPFVAYVSVTVFLLMVMVLAALFETYVSPVLLNWTAPYMTSA
ncbi:MAG TPA: stage II sporulation protein M [Bacilli bacterium]